MIRLKALLIILILLSSISGLASSGSRPEASAPFEVKLALSEDLEVMALPSEAVFQNGADRLADLQNDDGGWDWPLYDGNPAKGSLPSTVGPIAKGLAEAYGYTGDPNHLAALQAAGTFLLSKKNNFSPPDGYLAAALDEISGGTTYTDHVMTNFYGPLAAGTYNRNGTGTLYDTAGYVTWLRTTRAGQGNPNLAAWDIGMGLVGADSVGADTTAWIAGLKAEIDELDGRDDYDVIGLAGAIYGLAYVGEDYDPVAGAHASAGSLADLGRVLAGYQLATGGFTRNSYRPGEGQNKENIHETAYAILALAELDRTTYLSTIQAAADYIESVQLGTGGWKERAGEGENNQITGEALWGIATAYPPPPEPGDITAHKFNDLLNGDGVQQAGEPSLSDWEMKLYQGFGCTGTSLVSGFTDMEGILIFSGLQPGEYSVMETLETGWQNTTDLCQDVTLAAAGSESVNFGNQAQTCIELIKTGPETADPGETITYHFEVHNCGQVKLAGGAQVYDPLFRNSLIWSGELLPGASHEFDKSYTLPEDQCGESTHEAWAIGHPPGFPAVRDDASWTVDVSCYTGECQPGTFIFQGSDPRSGAAGNIRTFTLNGATVKVSGWSRDKDTGAYAPAYVGAYSGGLGVTDLVSDGNGSNDQHNVDNEDMENYLLFEFDRPVVSDQICLGYVLTDSDATLWFGNAPAGAELSDALLNGLNPFEDNPGNHSSRWADFNSSSQAGNMLVVAARVGDTDDHFKVRKLTYTCSEGQIVVEKQTDPDGADESFEFSTDFGPNFTLQDDDTYRSPLLAPGAYAVSEVNIPDGWELTGVACSDGSQPGAIDLSPGETVTCIFNNTKDDTLGDGLQDGGEPGIDRATWSHMPVTAKE
ncbi:MAG: hypothetical protein AB1649_05825 [Chloroflexota bacterium]